MYDFKTNFDGELGFVYILGSETRVWVSMEMEDSRFGQGISCNSALWVFGEWSVDLSATAEGPKLSIRLFQASVVPWPV